MVKNKKCDVCEKNLIIDKYGNGKCKNCGWNNDENALIYPNAVNPPNFFSLNEAKSYYLKNKKFMPTFERVISLVDRGIDINFKYNKSLFQLSKHNDYTFWEVDTDNYQSYDTIDEFRKKINIDGIRVEDLWDEVKKVDFAD